MNEDEIVLTRDGELHGSIDDIDPGRYGIEVVGYEVTGGEICAIAHQCRDISFEAGGKRNILIELVEIDEPVCMPISGDAGVVDGAVDAGVDGNVTPPRDAAVCIRGTEVCNNRDDDCDDNVDETTDKEADRANCGVCNNTCDEGLTCAAGRCSQPIVQIAPGYAFTCARRGNGTVFCWGDNSYGQLGNGTFIERLVPTQVTGLTDAVEIGSGKYHACARRPNGDVMCWGNNDSYQMATTSGNVTVPTRILGVDPVVSLGMGFYHACVVTEDHEVVCWGWNGHGQLGQPFATETDLQSEPMQVLNLDDVAQVDGGWSFTCARHTNGRVSCWGANDEGQLGDGTTTDRITPAFVKASPGVPLDDVTSIAASADHVCVLQGDDEDGERNVLCWGSNYAGEIGNGAFSGPVTVPTSTGINDAIELGIGLRFSCARRSNGVALCWGANDYGQLGLGHQTQRNVPTAVAGLNNARVLNVDNGDIHTCVVRDDLFVMCWGANYNGQLGNGTKSNNLQLVPARVPRI